MSFSILLCNTFLAVDLVLVIKNPFYPKDWRFIKLYAPITFCLGSLYGLIITIFFKDNAQNPKEIDGEPAF